MKPISEQNFYELLDVPVDATAEVIEQAYERAVRQLGPDSIAVYSLVSPEEAEALLARIEDAYLTLTDAALRAEYDAATLPPEHRAHPAPPPVAEADAGRDEAEGEIVLAPAADRLMEEAPPNDSESIRHGVAEVGVAPESPREIPLVREPAPAESVPPADEAAAASEPVRAEADDVATSSAEPGEQVEDAEPVASGQLPVQVEVETSTDAAVPMDSSEPDDVAEVSASSVAVEAQSEEHQLEESEPSLATEVVAQSAANDDVVEGTEAEEATEASLESDEPSASEPPSIEAAAVEVDEANEAPDASGEAEPEDEAQEDEAEEAEARASSAEEAPQLLAAVKPLPPAHPQVIPSPKPPEPEQKEPVRVLPRMPEIGPDTVINGELLRAAREARGVTIRDLSEKTKIGRTHLENLEADRYETLPVAVYLRGFLMSVARELKLDPLRISKGYLETVARSKGKQGS